MQRPSHLDLALADRSKACELDQHALALVPSQILLALPRTPGGKSFEGTEPFGQKCRIECPGNALRASPALAVRIAGMRSEVAGVTRQERDSLERDAPASERVGNRPEGASGKARPFVDDDVMRIRVNRVGREFDLTREWIAAWPHGNWCGCAEGRRDNRPERRADAANADHARRSAQPELPRGFGIGLRINRIERESFGQAQFDALGQIRSGR
jgi:hypothetical protein